MTVTEQKITLMRDATDECNAEFADTFRAFLDVTIADAPRHARFLNMLSMLEDKGRHKIQSTRENGLAAPGIDQHLAEEMGHAKLFKRYAQIIAGRAIPCYGADETLCPAEGLFYFDRLDYGLTHPLPSHAHPETGYLLVSKMIELRAGWVYNMYQSALEQAGVRLNLKNLLAEEDRHLADMVARLDAIGYNTLEGLPNALALEKSLFEKLFTAMRVTRPTATVTSAPFAAIIG